MFKIIITPHTAQAGMLSAFHTQWLAVGRMLGIEDMDPWDHMKMLRLFK